MSVSSLLFVLMASVIKLFWFSCDSAELFTHSTVFLKMVFARVATAL